MKVGIYWYKKSIAWECPTLKRGKKYLVYVTKHVWESNGRISNWVDFQLVNKDGSLGSVQYGTYDFHQFVVAKKHKIHVVEA